jgi:ubiquinone/menaquinone biosynthesis C-methylase UbiE
MHVDATGGSDVKNQDADTATIRRRYDRLAPFFDVLESAMERMSFARWRARQWSVLPEVQSLLEVGVGTGKNFPFYPSGPGITAIDFSPTMLQRAERQAARRGLKADLRLMDVQQLEFEPQSFDAVIGSFVFCSVPDPALGLSEIRRVLKPGGKLVLLEHVLSNQPLVAGIMQCLSPLVVRLLGANLDRRTVDTVIAAGFEIERVTDLSGDIVKLIEATRTA